MDTYIEQSLAKLEEFEGVIPWMYRDTVGKVTVGVGSMLPDVQAAGRLPFQHATAGRSATPDEIAAEFARVDELPMGRPALFYRSAQSLTLERAEIDALLRRIVEDLDQELTARLPEWAGLPVGAKLALLDMGYNLGTAGLVNGYPKMMRAIQAGQWPQAAAASFRHGPGAARNQWTQAMLLGGVAGSITAAAENRLKRLGYGLIGMVSSWLGY